TLSMRLMAAPCCCGLWRGCRVYYRRATVDPSTAGGESRRGQIGGAWALAGAVPVGMVGVRFAAEAHLDRGNRDLRRSHKTLDRCRSRATIATCVAPT